MYFIIQNKKIILKKATAVACVQDFSTKRPLIGKIDINFENVEYFKTNELYYFGIFLHQLFHVLGFSRALFENFYNDNAIRHISEVIQTITLNDVQFQGFILPKALSYAKDYFKCDSLQGIPLENAGTVAPAPGEEVFLNSHWEKNFFPFEVKIFSFNKKFMYLKKDYDSFIISRKPTSFNF